MQCRATNEISEAYTENPVGRKGGRTSLKQFSLVTLQSRWRRCYKVGSQHKGIVIGEIPEGLPGSESVARRKRDVRNLGDPIVSLAEGRVYQPKRRPPMDRGESDRSIVL